jgi:glc operon protein GlcG
MPQLIETRSPSRELARIGIDRAIVESVALGCRTCIAVVDAEGRLVSYDRMDGAPFQSAQHAMDKAISSAGNRIATHEMWEYIKDDPWLRQGINKIEGLNLLGGGIPIKVGDEVIGAVGVSGSCGMVEDRAAAEAAVAAIVAAITD